MSKFEKFIQCATYRLRADPELHMDVANELRAHLDDAYESACSAGASEAHAEGQAMREFGDADEIADRLWEANLRRMRLRAVAKWAGRLVLVPVGIVLALLLCWEALGFVGVLNMTGAMKTEYLGAGRLGNRIAQQARLPYRTDLTDEEKAASETDWNRFDPVRNLVEQFPENRLFRARAAVLCVYEKVQAPQRHGLDLPLKEAVASLEDALKFLDECERVEPQNALYNYLKAGALFFLGAEVEHDPDFAFTTTDANGDARQVQGYRLVIIDNSLFQRGLQEHRMGIAKPYCDDYVVPFTDYYIGLRRTPQTLLQEMQRIAIAAGQLMPHLTLMRPQSRVVMAYASTLVGEGRYGEARELIRTAPVPGTHLGARNQTLIGVLVGRDMRAIALSHGAALYERMGMEEQAAKAREIEGHERGRHGVAEPPSEEEQIAHLEHLHKQGGILGAVLLPRVPVPDAMLEAIRRAERANLERTALGVLAVLFLFIIAWCGALTLLAMWRHRKDSAGPKFWFVGWKRLGGVILAGVALPVAAYALLTRLPFGSAHYGVNYAPWRVALEMAFTIALVLGLTPFFAVRAFRQRARDAGLAVPECRSAAWSTGMVVLVCAVAGVLGSGLVFWHRLNAPLADYLLLAGIVCALLLAWALLRRSMAEYREYFASERRSILTVLVICLVAVGMFTRAYLYSAERTAIRTMQQSGIRPYSQELKYSAWGEYQEYLKTLPRQGALSEPTS